jgi:predicted Rossmann fold nucleotide-binding protein DprA/Smf involved in DNA uptake
MTCIAEPAYWLALAYQPNLRLVRVKAIIADWCLEGQQPLSTLFELAPAEVGSRFGLDGSECAAIGAARESVIQRQAWLAQLMAGGVSVVTRADPTYPSALTRMLPMSLQPLCLFCRGSVDTQSRALAAIVGEKDASQPAMDLARDLAALLAGEGIAVVSGLNKGVGRVSLEGALSADGQAIVVLPMGVHAFNADQDLAQAIGRGELSLISPFHPDAPFSEANAAARNRLIAALVDGLIVLHCGEQGLVRDMADEALSLGKGVYVWESDSASGTVARGHCALIEAGGLPVGNVADVIDIIDTLQELVLERQAGLPVPAVAVEESLDDSQDDMDPQAVLEVLSRAGRVPDVLLKRLGTGAGSRS